VREGFKDLEYMPRARSGWNATLSAYAYGVRRNVARAADLALWAVMHGCPASARYQELGDKALVLWHGTSAQRAQHIREHGLFHKRGVWATFEPKIAHGYTRGRSLEYGAGSATVVLVLDGAEVRPGVDYDQEGPEIVRFRYDLPREWVEYILWDDRVEFVGEQQAGRPERWGLARFKKKEGEWVPRSRPPVRFDSEHTYASKEEWLHLAVRRVISTLGSASAIEIFSSLYSTIHPWDALSHEDVFGALGALCPPPRRRRGTMLFSLASAPGV
jgi:hypothetical protein